MTMPCVADEARTPSVDLDLEDLARDPYPIYAELRRRGRAIWVAPLRMWYVTDYAEVRDVLTAPDVFTTNFEASTIYDTFGPHMLTLDGPEQVRQKNTFRPAFTRQAVGTLYEKAIAERATALIEGFKDKREVEFRHAFASRLPIQVILSVFGLPLEEEPRLRQWYDAFEAALANFHGDAAVREAGRRDAAAFRVMIQSHIERVRGKPDGGLLSRLVHAAEAERLSDMEICRNASIVFFGGISTVEALILNSLWALAHNPQIESAVRANPQLLPDLADETMRWAGPVQSATRHAARNASIGGTPIPAGDTVNCILAAANRDPAIFVDPDRFDIARPNNRAQLGFAMGAHFCLGSHLAKLEMTIALSRLFELLPDARTDLTRTTAPYGYEFRQPRALTLTW